MKGIDIHAIHHLYVEIFRWLLPIQLVALLQAVKSAS